MKLVNKAKRGLMVAVPVLAVASLARATDSALDTAVSGAMTSASTSVSSYVVAGIGIAAIIFGFVVLARLLKRGL